MSDRQKSKAKKVVYRKRHKSLGHLMANDTKHAFEERLQGALQRQESEPVYFGVSVMSAQENHSNVESFESVTQYNYQEAAKQRATRTRLTSSKHQSPRHVHGHGPRLRPEQSHLLERFRQVDCSRRMHIRERTRPDCLPGGCTPVQESLKEIQGEGTPDIQSSPIPSQLGPHATRSFPTFPTPFSMANPPTSVSFAFAGLTEVPSLLPISPSMVFEDNGISGGLGSSSINQSKLSFDQAFASRPPPQPALNDFQETCQGEQFHPYHIHGACQQTLPFYDLQTESYNFNQHNFELPNTFSSNGL